MQPPLLPSPVIGRGSERDRGEGKRRAGNIWLLALLLIFISTVVHAQTPLVVCEVAEDSTAFYEGIVHGGVGLVHLGTGTLPPASTEPVDTLIAKAKRGEIRLALVARSEHVTLPPKLRKVAIWGLPVLGALTSGSTRTQGLITAADLIGEGRPIRAESTRPVRVTIFLRDLVARIAGTEEAKVPLLALWGLLVVGGLALASRALHQKTGARLAHSTLVAATAGTLSASLPADW